MSDKKTSERAFGDWYRDKFGHDCTGADLRVRMAWEAGVRWLTKHSGQGGADIYTMTADELRERLIRALEENDRFAARICDLEDAANVRADA